MSRLNQGGMSPTTLRGQQRTLITQNAQRDMTDSDRVAGGPGAEPTYCFCNNVSYGDMIACDNEVCMYEWFHFPCVGISEKPQAGQLWYCHKCAPYF